MFLPRYFFINLAKQNPLRSSDQHNNFRYAVYSQYFPYEKCAEWDLTLHNCMFSYCLTDRFGGLGTSFPVRVHQKMHVPHRRAENYETSRNR